MAGKLPRFYPILDPSVRPDLTLEELARPLADAGVRLIQLRMKDAPGGDVYDYALRLLRFLPAEVKLIVNDRADVAKLAGAAGVHLGQDDLPPEEARKLLGTDAVIGYSTHTGEQVRAAQEDPVDYLAFGPVFATATKKDADNVVGLDGLRGVREIHTGPLAAIGGITAENAARVTESGADSVAVISGWMSADDIPARLEEFRRALGRLD